MENRFLQKIHRQMCRVAIKWASFTLQGQARSADPAVGRGTDMDQGRREAKNFEGMKFLR